MAGVSVLPERGLCRDLGTVTFAFQNRKMAALPRLALFLLLISCVTVGRARGQGPTDAVLRGRVVDARDGTVPGAEVDLLPADAASAEVTMHPARTRVDQRGGFTLLGLVPGMYRALVRLPGGGVVGSIMVSLEAGEVTETELRVGGSFPWITLFAMPLEGAADEFGAEGAVQVSKGDTELANDHRATDKQGERRGADVGAGRRASTRVVSQAGLGADTVLGDLPLEGRQWEGVEELSGAAHDATLADGGAAQDDTDGEGTTAAAREGQGTGSAASGLSYDGLPATENAASVEGLSADQGFSGGPRGSGVGSGGARTSSGFAQGAVRAVKAIPHTFSAQYGGAAGGLVTVVARGAEGRLRGTAFLQERESGWGAVNPYAVVTHYNGGAVTSAAERPSDATLQLGGAAGLPVRLPGVMRGWRSGVFGSAEEQLRTQTLVSSPLTANFYSLTAEQQALLGTRGVTAGATKAALEYLDGLTGTAAVRTPRLLAFGRLDTSPEDRDRLSVTVQFTRGTGPATGGGGSSEGVINRAVSSLGTSEVHAEAYTAAWQRSVSARAVNNLRTQWAHDLQFETPGAGTAAVPGVGPGGYAPQVSIQPEGFTYGTPASLGRVAYPDEQRVEVADSFALRLGRHLVTLGGDWSRLHDRVLAATNLEGAFSYNNTTASGHDGGLVDWITDYTFNVHAYPNGGCPSVYAAVHYFCFHSYTQGFTGPPTEFVTHAVAGFAEDSVRLRRDLLVSFGVRYDYLLLPFPQQPNVALDAVLREIQSAGGGAGNGVTASFPEDRNNTGPRVSAVWSPGRRGHRWLTARVGYGLFFGRLPGATITAALADTGLPSSTSRIRITPKVETSCPQVANQGFGYPCAFESLPIGTVGQTASTIVFGSRFRLPAVQRATLGFDRELGRRLLVQVGYATAWATQLPESTDLNVAPSTESVTYVLQGGDEPGERNPGLHTGETFAVPQYTARQTAKYGPVTALVSNANATYHSGEIGAQLREFHGWGARGSYTFARAIDYGPQSGATPRQDGQFDPFSNGYDKGLSSLQIAHHFTGNVSFRSSWSGGSREMRAALGGWRFAATGVAGSGAPYSYVIYGGTRLAGGRESINGSGGATYLPTVGRNTLRLPPRGVVNLRTARELPLPSFGGRAMRLSVQADAFNLLNSVSLSQVETRAFLLGTPVGPGAATPLLFQDAGTIATEGLTTQAFGTPLSSTSGVSRERQVELGVRLSF